MQPYYIIILRFIESTKCRVWLFTHAFVCGTAFNGMQLNVKHMVFFLVVTSNTWLLFIIIFFFFNSYSTRLLVAFFLPLVLAAIGLVLCVILLLIYILFRKCNSYFKVDSFFHVLFFFFWFAGGEGSNLEFGWSICKTYWFTRWAYALSAFSSRCLWPTWDFPWARPRDAWSCWAIDGQFVIPLTKCLYLLTSLVQFFFSKKKFLYTLHTTGVHVFILSMSIFFWVMMRYILLPTYLWPHPSLGPILIMGYCYRKWTPTLFPIYFCLGYWSSSEASISWDPWLLTKNN